MTSAPLGLDNFALYKAAHQKTLGVGATCLGIDLSQRNSKQDNRKEKKQKKEVETKVLSRNLGARHRMRKESVDTLRHY